MKKSFLFFCLYFLLVPNMKSQNCSIAASVALEVWKKTGEWTHPTTYNHFRKQFDIQKTTWKEIIASSGNTFEAKQVRHLSTDKKTIGTVNGGSKRIYVTNPLYYDHLKIELHKTGGRGRTVVSVCIHDDMGNIENVNDYSFSNSGLTSTNVFDVPNVSGKIVSIYFSCKNKLKSFSYAVKVENNITVQID